jgi:hypothetical protein
MADLTELQSSQSVKVIGANASLVETYPQNVSANLDAFTVDRVNTSGVYSSLTVGTTAVELKVGASPLTERKLVTLDNTSNTTIYWAYSNALTTTTYAGRIFKDQQASWPVGPSVSIWLIAGSAGNTVRISEGA